MVSQQWKKYITDLLPLQCELCGLAIESDLQLTWLCGDCIRYFTEQTRCQCCGLLMLSSVSQCGACLTKLPLWQRVYCVGDYQPPLSTYVHNFKYLRQFWQAEKLAQLLSPRIHQPADLITSVPLHWRRHWVRGFNQSELLARALSSQLQRPYQTLFKRVRATSPQQGKNRQQRRSNLKRAFKLYQPVTADRVAIVDDVLTTGSTVQHLCKLLLDAGVKSVDIYTICRTPEPSDKS